jgi:hypothetical protein
VAIQHVHAWIPDPTLLWLASQTARACLARMGSAIHQTMAHQHVPAGTQSCHLSVRSLVFPSPAPQIIARNHGKLPIPPFYAKPGLISSTILQGASLTLNIASDRTILHWHIQACITVMRHAVTETLSLLSDLLPPTRGYVSHSQTILGLGTPLLQTILAIEVDLMYR